MRRLLKSNIAIWMALILVSVAIGVLPTHFIHVKAENDAQAEREEVEQELQAEAKSEYLEQANTYASDMTDLSNEFSTLLDEWTAGDIYNVRDGWVDEMSGVMSGMRDAMSEYRRQAVPTSDTRKIHNNFIRSMQEQSYVVDNFPDVYDNKDSELMSLIADHINEAGRLMEKAKDEIGK